MRLVMLIENTAVSQKLLVEHGMSVFIENGDNYSLFGTGAGSKLVNNAKRMKLPLERISAAVIPHNHYAYTGGLDSLWQVSPDMKVFALRAADCQPVQKKGLFSVPVGDLSDKIRKHRERFVLFESFQQVSEGFFLLRDECREEEFYVTDRNYRIKTGDELETDDMSQECFGVLFPSQDRKKGCVIIGGCAHCGLPNMIKTVRKNWGDIPVLAILTGLHFMGSSTKKLGVDTEFMARTAEEIKALNVGAVYTCHCTGLRGYEELKTFMGDQLEYLQTGEELSF